MTIQVKLPAHLNTCSHVRGLGIYLCMMLSLLLAGCVTTPPPESSPYTPKVQPHPYSVAPVGSRAKPARSAVQEAPVASSQGNHPETKIALLLPLSGKSSALGQAMLDAAMLGLFDKYAATPLQAGQSRITLLPKDTRGEAKRAAKMAKEAADDGASLILGPLFSHSVKAITPVARKRNIPVISFSNNAKVAAKGVYLFGFMPHEQVQHVVDYANRQGYSRIAAFIPSNPYGDIVEESLRDYAKLHGLELAGVIPYPIEAEDIGIYAQRLTEATPRNEPIPIDAIFIAETGERLNQMVTRLDAFRLGRDNVKYLGTGLWDDPALMEIDALRGAWFASTSRVPYNGFVSRFTAANDYTPPRIASLAYDAVALAATLAIGDNFSPETLTRASGYEGAANGIFKLHENGKISRGLSVLEIQATTMQELTTAPRMFE